jgi:hypothetical protein
MILLLPTHCLHLVLLQIRKSFIQSSDRTSPTNRLETSVCLLEDDLSFFTAMNEPQLSIEADVTAANSAQSQGFIFSDFLQGCVENSLV